MGDREILDRLPGGFLSFGDDGLIQDLNRPLEAMFGYGPGELMGQHVETLLTVPSRIFYHTHILPLLKMQGRLQEAYVSGRSKSGDELPLLVNASRYEQEGVVLNECLITIMRKRSEYEDEILRAKKAAERADAEKAHVLEKLDRAHKVLERQQEDLQASNRELQKLKDSLEERVAERTAELNFMVEELQGFTYSVAHDLRTPLRSIVANSMMLQEDASHELSPENLDMLREQKANALKLATLVDDLLQFSRLGFNPIFRQKVDLSKLVRTIGSELIEEHKRTNIELVVEDGIEAAADLTMIQLVLQNLLDNAIKYSPDGGRVMFGAMRHENACAYFVRDEGIGIDSAYQQKIFQPFQRLHRDMEYSGNGIGLANAQRIINRHGGQIWVESAPNRGSTFYFTLE
jgi:PAS domain S-box-containing protein